MIEDLLNQDDEVLDSEIIPYLATMMPAAQTQVLALVEPFFGRGEQWNRRLMFLARHIQPWNEAGSARFFERVVREVPEFDFKDIYEVDDIAEAAPHAGCLLIRALCDRVLDKHLDSVRQHQTEEPPLDREDDESRTRHFKWLVRKPRLINDLEVFNGSTFDTALKIVTHKGPHEFLSQMLPWLERVLELDESDGITEEGWPYFSNDALSFAWNGSPYVVQHLLIEAMIEALVALARSDRAVFERVAEQLAAMASATPQQLLGRVYTATPELLAADALAYLQSDPRRLNLGDPDCWETRQIIKAIRPHLEEAQKAALERCVLNHENSLETRHRWPGLTQAQLLREMKDDASKEALKRLQELERKNYRPNAGPSSFVAVRSSGDRMSEKVPADVAQKMSDKAWLRAMGHKTGRKLRRYRVLEADARRKLIESLSGAPDHLMDEILAGEPFHQSKLSGYSGGPPGSYVELVVKEPERFANLLLSAPPDVRTGWIEATLNGIAETEALDAETALRCLSQIILRYGLQPPPRITAQHLVGFADVDATSQNLHAHARTS